MSSLRSLTVAAFSLLCVIGACSSHSTNKPLVCQDSDSSNCTAATGCEGTRICLEGEWTECVCGGTLDGAGGSATTANTSNGPSTTGGANTMGNSSSGGSSGDGANSTTSSTSSTSTQSGGAGGSSGGSGGATSTAGSGGGVNSPVRGTVVNHWLHPVPEVTVMIGDQVTTTDGDGAFEFEDVPGTYDVMLDLTYLRYGATGRYGWVYQGVTRRDPTLQVYGGLSLRTANVRVSPTNFTAVEGGVVAMALGGDYGRYDREGTSAAQSMLSYFGPPSVTMYGHGLQWIESDGLPTSYVAYGTTSLLAFDSELADPVDFVVDPSSEAVASGTISGSVTSSSSDARRNAVYVRFASNALIQVVEDASGIEENFAYTVPSLPDASILVAAHEGDLYEGPRAVAYQNGLSPGATNVALTVPSPAVLTAPANAAALVDTTVFSWDGDAQTFVWLLWSDSVNEGIHVVTSQKQLTLPTFPNGLDLVRPGETYSWRVETHGDAESVDAMLGADGFMGDFNDIAYDEPDGPGAGSGHYTATAVRGVTTVE
ncbi:MAG TPA: hypothetical protein VI197_21830 [Polyangiaceae bacterium]